MVSRRPAGVTELPPAVQIKMVRVPSDTKKKNTTRLDGVFIFGTAKGTRTPDLLIRSQSLYPTELLPHGAFLSAQI